MKEPTLEEIFSEIQGVIVEQGLLREGTR